MSKVMYPITPTKASEIKEGEYFYIPLNDGRFACGRILLIEKKNGRKTKLLLVGLHDWSGSKHPSQVDIHECPIIEQGVLHINSISHVGGEIIGFKPLQEDGLKPFLQVEAGYLLDGFENLGSIPSEEYCNYTRRTTYGLNSISLKANKYFAKNS
ncbi:hypothetical protein HF888_06825 [Bermanella marisrubri]|nr:Imm26 family immunity protein [Bermanella marisrubri]QIZ83957.1 hypothetical protein HF888_06825 [Bermanella marisrubri]